MSLLGIGEVADLGTKILEKIIPDAAQAEKYKFALLQLQQSGELAEMANATKIITTDAASSDKWTARARPWFLYVMYILLLASIPMGVCHSINPVVSHNMELGMADWFKTIPNELWVFFGISLTGESFLYIKKALSSLPKSTPSQK